MKINIEIDEQNISIWLKIKYSDFTPIPFAGFASGESFSGRAPFFQ